MATKLTTLIDGKASGLAAYDAARKDERGDALAGESLTRIIGRQALVADNGPSARDQAVVSAMARRSYRGPAIRPIATRADKAFANYIRGGDITRALERRDLSEATNAAGGYLVPTAFDDDILLSLQYASAVWAAGSRVWQSPSGSAGYYPMANDTTVTGTTIAENTAQTETDLAGLVRVSFGITPIWGGNTQIRMGQALLQDSGVDIEGVLTEAFSARIARGLDLAFITTALAGMTTNVTTSASPTALVYNDVLSAFYALDPAYRNSPSCTWLVHPNTAKALRAVEDSQGRPIWIDHPANMLPVQDSFLGGTGQQLTVPTIFGKRVLESKAVPQIGATHNVAIVADWSRAFVIRVAERASLMALRERWADYGEIGFLMYGRYDGAVGLPDAASVLACHA